jgi:hypothetical protein
VSRFRFLFNESKDSLDLFNNCLKTLCQHWLLSSLWKWCPRCNKIYKMPREIDLIHLAYWNPFQKQYPALLWFLAKGKEKKMVKEQRGSFKIYYLKLFFGRMHNSTRGFHCDNSVGVNSVLWTNSPPVLYYLNLSSSCPPIFKQYLVSLCHLHNNQRA